MTGVFWGSSPPLCIARLIWQAYLQHPLEKGHTHFPLINYDSGFLQKRTDVCIKGSNDLMKFRQYFRPKYFVLVTTSLINFLFIKAFGIQTRWAFWSTEYWREGNPCSDSSCNGAMPWLCWNASQMPWCHMIQETPTASFFCFVLNHIHGHRSGVYVSTC